MRATLLAAWRADGSVLPIASDAAETLTILEGDAFAVETNRKPYAFGQKFGRHDENVDLINLATGSNTSTITKVGSRT